MGPSWRSSPSRMRACSPACTTACSRLALSCSSAWRSSRGPIMLAASLIHAMHCLRAPGRARATRAESGSPQRSTGTAWSSPLTVSPSSARRAKRLAFRDGGVPVCARQCSAPFDPCDQTDTDVTGPNVESMPSSASMAIAGGSSRTAGSVSVRNATLTARYSTGSSANSAIPSKSARTSEGLHSRSSQSPFSTAAVKSTRPARLAS